MKKGTTKGLVDYFLGGAPNVSFAYLIMRKRIKPEKLHDIHSFPKFLKEYFNALVTLRDESKSVEETLSMFKPDQRAIVTPPATNKYKKKFVKKPDARVHFVDEDFDEVDDPDEEAVREEDELYETADEGRKAGDKGSASEEEIYEDAVTGEEEQPQDQSAGSAQAWLAGVSFHPERPAVCFDMALRNRCKRLEEKGHCPFSHHPEDIRMFKLSDAMGTEAAKAFVKSAAASFSKTHTDTQPKSSSQGARPQDKKSVTFAKRRS